MNTMSSKHPNAQMLAQWRMILYYIKSIPGTIKTPKIDEEKRKWQKTKDYRALLQQSLILKLHYRLEYSRFIYQLNNYIQSILGEHVRLKAEYILTYTSWPLWTTTFRSALFLSLSFSCIFLSLHYAYVSIVLTQ